MADARALLVDCLLAAAGERPAIARLAARARPGAAVGGLVPLARALAISETCGHALLAAGVLDALGEPGRALRDDGENAAAKNTLLVAEAIAIQRALADCGIPSVALKGAALVAAHYPAIGARHVGDLDLLVRPADAGRADGLLRVLGCAPDRPDLPGFDGRPFDARHHHHLAPLRTPGGIACELHRAVPGVRGRRADVEGVLARALEVRWRGAALRVPAPDDLLGIACAHALGAHAADRRFVPRHVADVAALLAAGADPGRANALHPGPAVGASLALLAAARAGDPGPIVGAGRAAGLVARTRLVAGALREARADGALLRLLFPARAFLAARYGVAPRSPWLPLLWAWRPVRGVARLVTGR